MGMFCLNMLTIALELARETPAYEDIATKLFEHFRFDVMGAQYTVTYQGRRYALSAHEYGGGSLDGDGYRQLESFHLEGALPVWTYAFGGALLE
jgi:hypothetical protein